MIKYIAIAYSLGGMPVMTSMDYCEIRDLQSPYVKKIDEAPVTKPVYTPVDTCNLSTVAIGDIKIALLECIKSRQNRHKI